MLNNLFTRLFGSRNERMLKQMRRSVIRINELEPSFQALDDQALMSKTVEFRNRLEAGETVDQLLPEAFAAVREAARRALGLRHYDVQLIGGMTLHQGRIAEMRTGEGKTLVATLPAYLNALSGKGVHIVTVNDYLARRDSAWMAPVFEALGMRVGVVYPGLPAQEKRENYRADITYATNNEIGFDYLRDNMAFSKDDRFQREFNFAIVDEVDSILIDEARTPLIISGPAEESPQLYAAINKVVPQLQRQVEEDGAGDFNVDEKGKQVFLTESGMEHAEKLLTQAGLMAEGESLYDVHNLTLVHHLTAGLRAHALYQRDVEYLVRDGEVVIVDEFTGRTLAGRRWSDGLHQAIEAKEGVAIQRENQTLASITFQNLFRLYPKLSGMTGTADTEAYEFQQIYGLEVAVIPTNRPMVRDDRMDVVYLTKAAKYRAILEDIRDCHQRGQPVLVGTTSIETSELISNQLKSEGVPHEVLNAKQHEREAHIVAQAGRRGAVTIATNMAGRGTDIVLGGNPEADLKALAPDATEAERQQIMADWKLRQDEIKTLGGLHIIGTERHESRRIDNQLRGRAGRQGDPGSSCFYVSLEDNLMRIFAADWVRSMMQKLGMKEDDVIQERMVSRAIERAQRKIEAHNFDIRKHLLEFDDVANDQRKVVYQQRKHLLEAEEIQETIVDIRIDAIERVLEAHVVSGSLEERWDVAGLEKVLREDFDVQLDIQSWLEQDSELTAERLHQRVREGIDAHFQAKEEAVGSEVMRAFEKAVMLNVLDSKWKDHLARMDYLRQGIHLRGYAQKQPMQEYKREAFQLFGEMLDGLKLELTRVLARVRIRSEDEVTEMEAEQRRKAPPMAFQHDSAPQPAMVGSEQPEPAPVQPGGARMPAVGQNATPFVRDMPKVGRNDPCPCGSGKKYKACHGRLD